MLGKYESRVVRAGCRRLILKKAGSVNKYNELFEEKIRHDKLKERLDELDIAIGDEDRLTKEQTERFETIHKQTTNFNYMQNGSAGK